MSAPTDAGGAVSEALREIARMREVASGWRHPNLAQIEGPNDLKIYGGTIADDIDRWADLLAALTPARQADGDKLRPIPSHPDAPLGRPKAPQPLQQGGEVTRNQVAREIAEGLSHLIDPAVINGASSRVAGRILALFASPDLGDLAERLRGILIEESPMHPFGCATWEEESRVAIDMAIDSLRSLAADRDKAVGLLRKWLASRTYGQRVALHAETDAFLSSQTEGS